MFKQPTYCLTLLLLLGTSPVHAEKIYRYTDKNGGIILGLTLPSDMGGRGYEVLDGETMRRIHLVKPALTPAQIEALYLERKAAEKATIDIARREKEYAALRASYSGESSLLAERDLEMSIRDKQLQASQDKQNQFEESLHVLQELAAQRELDGHGVSKGITRNIETINNNLIINQAVIDLQQSEYNERTQWFAEKRIALREALAFPPLAKDKIALVKPPQQSSDNTEN